MSTTHHLKNQTAIITGAGRGIGRATALALAEAGAAVVLVARSADEVNSVADEIKFNGASGQALAIPTDISDPAEVDHLLVLTLRAFGQIDILVNNAAMINPIGKVWETSPLAWQKLIATNLLGPYFCARAVLPHMLERGSGRIINISSAAADINLEGTSAYNASKAALERFSGTLAAEVDGTGVVVTTFRPGTVDTGMQAEMRQTPAQFLPKTELFQSFFDKGQLRSPDEIAQAVLWLASRFSVDTNGQRFDIEDKAFRQRVTSDLLGLAPVAPKEHTQVNNNTCPIDRLNS
jgi:NAD(P)-dependent dehydrogenase (short-subunit alcohol dehydrogenase family)